MKIIPHPQSIKSALLLCSALSFSAFADIPHTFISGTPAKASDVNDNFEALDNRISEIVAVGDAAEIDLCEGVHSSFTAPPKRNLTYSYANSEPGDRVTIKGIEYVVVKLPFVEIGTGDYYSVKLLSPYPSNIYDYFLIETRPVISDAQCQEVNISGYPATTNGYFSRRLRISFNNGYGSNKGRSDAQFTFGVDIKINGTLLSISHFTSILEMLSNHEVGNYDFTDAIDKAAMTTSPPTDEEFNMYISHIKIERTQ